jgi:hypothetical protein
MNFVTGNCNVSQLNVLPHGRKLISLFGTCCDWILLTLRLLTPCLVVLRAYQPRDVDLNLICSPGAPDAGICRSQTAFLMAYCRGGKRYDAEVVLSHVYSKSNLTS